MGDDDENYKLFYLKNREFSFEVDVSELQCGMNGAMYFCEMAADGEKGQGRNNAGAKYGTGYCDAQCPHDMKFIDGEANVIDWVPNPNDKSNNMGTGKYGTCCAEMDIWEANSMATVMISSRFGRDWSSVRGPNLTVWQLHILRIRARWMPSLASCDVKASYVVTMTKVN